MNLMGRQTWMGQTFKAQLPRSPCAQPSDVSVAATQRHVFEVELAGTVYLGFALGEHVACLADAESASAIRVLAAQQHARFLVGSLYML